MDDITKSREKFKSQLTDNIALGATVAIPIKLAIDFETSMADVKKVLDFKNYGEFKKLGNDLLSLSTKMPVTANGLAQIAASGGSLGVATKDILGFTKSVGIMSTAFDMDAKDAGESMGKMMNVYGLTITQVNALGDTINSLDNGMAAHARDIVNVTARVGGIAKVYGITSDTTAALSATFLSLGAAPEVAGTAINSLLTKMATADKGSKKFEEALHSVGMSGKGLKSMVDKDATGALSTFLHTLEKIPKTKKMGILTDLFGAEHADEIALLVGGLKEYDKGMKIANDTTGKAGSMQKEFAIQSATTKNNLATFTNSIGIIGVKIGTVFLPGLIAIVNPLRDFSIKLGEFTDKHQTATKIIGGFLIGMVGVTLALAVGGYAFSFIAGGILKFKDTYSALTFSIKNGNSTLKFLGSGIMNIGKALLWVGRALLMNPIGLVITAIAVGAYLIYRNWDTLKPYFVKVWNGIKGVFGFAKKWIVGYITDPIGTIKTVWSNLFGWFGEKFASIFKSIKGLTPSGVFKSIATIGIDAPTAPKFPNAPKQAVLAASAPRKVTVPTLKKREPLHSFQYSDCVGSSRRRH